MFGLDSAVRGIECQQKARDGVFVVEQHGARSTTGTEERLPQHDFVALEANRIEAAHMAFDQPVDAPVEALRAVGADDEQSGNASAVRLRPRRRRARQALLFTLERGLGPFEAAHHLTRLPRRKDAGADRLAHRVLGERRSPFGPGRRRAFAPIVCDALGPSLRDQ